MVRSSGVQVSGVCVIAGCGGDAVCKGLCRSHYDRQRYSGRARKVRMSRACLQCGRFFETERKDRKFCAARCRVAWWRRAKSSPMRLDSTPNPLKPVVWENARKAKAEGIEPVRLGVFTVSDVWRRCGGVCAGCGKAVRRGVSADSGFYGVPVWLVPPDKGGVMGLENKVIMHPECARRHAERAVCPHGRKRGAGDGRKLKGGAEARE